MKKPHIYRQSGNWCVLIPYFAMETVWPDLNSAMEYVRLIFLWKRRNSALEYLRLSFKGFIFRWKHRSDE